MPDIIVGLLAFLGAFFGTKRLKRHLIDNYIEARVTKALDINDKVLSKIRTVLSELEQTYSDNRPVMENDLNDVIGQCREISNMSVDGGKEVSTVAYLLYRTVEDLKPTYESNSKYGKSKAALDTRSVVGFVDSSLRLMIHYCNVSTPIPFRTTLSKRSTIKRGLRKYLSDKSYYSLKHQPFGLTLNPNSEVVLQYSQIAGGVSTEIFRKNLFMTLQSNLPIAYELIAGRIYMPLVLLAENDIGLFGKPELHLIKVQSMRTIGQEGGDYFDFYYSNISPRFKFVDSYSNKQICDDFVLDRFTNTHFSLNDYQKAKRRPDETIKIRVDPKKARDNFRINKWRIRKELIKARFLH